MTPTYYFGKKPLPENKILRRVLIFFGITAILATAFILGYLYQYNTKLTQTFEAFQTELEEEDYQEALSMYRGIQAVVTEQPADSSTREKELLQSMEKSVKEKTDLVLTKIRSDRYVLNAGDRAFLEQLGEVTGAVISHWLSELCHEFLVGDIERPTLQFVFDQLGDLANVSAASAPLQASMDNIETVAGDIRAAEEFLAEQSFISAVKKYQDVYDAYNEDEFIGSFCQTRIVEAKKMMYDPLIEQCKDLMRYLRFYSSEKILSDMSRIFPGDPTVEALLLEATANTSRVVPYSGDVEVIAVRPLLADTDLAFSESNYAITEDGYLTAGEFFGILQGLYDNNYILIDVRLMTDQSNLTQIVEEPMQLPEGKKPVIIIAENINYSPRSMGLGFCRRLVLNEENQVSGEYITASGETVVDRLAESVGILDAFVEEHPDFSFDGAKGIISFSGFEVVMGYITEEDQIEDYNFSADEAGALTQLPSQSELAENRETVKAIVQAMRDTGWVMASSTYGYKDANKFTMEELQSDTNKWLTQVGSLTGEAGILVYPFGSFINGSDPRCVFLKENGFRIFFGISPTPYKTFGDNYLYLDRALMNGENLRTQDYSRLFDVANIYDPARRT